jgi:HlyD family secretion protein
MVTIIINNYNSSTDSTGTLDGNDSIDRSVITVPEKSGSQSEVIDGTTAPKTVLNKALPQESSQNTNENKEASEKPVSHEPATKDDSHQPKAEIKDDPVEKNASKESTASSEEKETPTIRNKLQKHLKLILAIALLLVVIAGTYMIWQYNHPKTLGVGFASGNGRIEAVELDIAAKSPGRISEMYADEGDLLVVGQIVARMDTDILRAQLRKAQAEEAQARSATSTALAIVVQHQSEQAVANAVVTQREAAYAVAEKTALRSQILSKEHASSTQEFDDDEARQREAAAAIVASKAQLNASQATVNAAHAQVLGTQSNVVAIVALESQIQAEIDDTVLKAVRNGRVQYRVAQPGEVIAAGGKVLSMVDLSDVTMTFFLPETSAGRVAIGSEVHIYLDAAPSEVIPATVIYVANVAQFTPKTVETKSEREKLVFRVKARISPELLRQRAGQVKSGLPGMAYVRLDASKPWPATIPIETQK